MMLKGPRCSFHRLDDEDVATRITKGWHLKPNVTWLDRAEREREPTTVPWRSWRCWWTAPTGGSPSWNTIELDEKSVCHITETDVNNRPFRVTREHPRRKYPCTSDYSLTTTRRFGPRPPKNWTVLPECLLFFYGLYSFFPGHLSAINRKNKG